MDHVQLRLHVAARECPHCEVRLVKCRCTCFTCFHERYLYSALRMQDVRGTTALILLDEISGWATDEEDSCARLLINGVMRIAEKVVSPILFCDQCRTIRRHRTEDCLCCSACAGQCQSTHGDPCGYPDDCEVMLKGFRRGVLSERFDE